MKIYLLSSDEANLFAVVFARAATTVATAAARIYQERSNNFHFTGET